MIPNDGPTISPEEREAKWIALSAEGHHAFEVSCECTYCHDLRADPRAARTLRKTIGGSLRWGVAFALAGMVVQEAAMTWADAQIAPWRHIVLNTLLWWILLRDRVDDARRWWALRRFV